MAISRKTLADRILKGQFTATFTALPPDIPGYNPDAALPEDVAKAKQLLADAGFKDGANFPPINITYQTSATDKTVAEYLQSTWKQNLGIESKPDPLEAKAFRDWFNARKDQPFNVHLGLWGSDWGDPANWHNQLFESSADFYHTHWKNPDFDKLVNDARGMTDQDKRIGQYKQAEKLLVQDAAMIPIFNLNRIFVIQPYVKGIYHYPILGRTFLKYVQIEKH